ncbi:hypothetical protein WJX74_007258 [Apatococcus lobatus]|uniref:phosphoribosylamine--glycine ligase n=1 Tax=Apatococcus lobatus TaxID=904363 RepID=A0AAW1QH10_9CHLO
MDLPPVDVSSFELSQAAPRTRSRRRPARTPYDRPCSRQIRSAQAKKTVQTPASFLQGLFTDRRDQQQEQYHQHHQTQHFPQTATEQLQRPALVLPQPELVGMELGWPITFAEHYDLGGCIGTGAFGTVHLATARASKQHVAVKILAKSRAKQAREKTLAKVQREAKLLSRVQECSGAARFLGKYEDQDFAYMVLELCQGGDLEQLLETRTTLTEPEAALILYECLKVISTCHQIGVVHGDVKPANFLAIDFGCSQVVKPNQPLSKRTGTPVYLAPEVYMRAYDERADMWSLGMMFFHLMTRAFPFWHDMDACRNSSLDSVMKAVTTGHIDMRAGPIQDLSPAGLHFLKQLLRRDPVLRITSEDALDHDFFRQHLATGDCHEDHEAESPAADRPESTTAGQHCSLLRLTKSALSSASVTSAEDRFRSRLMLLRQPAIQPTFSRRVSPLHRVQNLLPTSKARVCVTAAATDKNVNVLIVGGGGREHALAWRIAQSPTCGHLHCAPGNAGTALEHGINNATVSISNNDAVVAWCKQEDIGLVVIGPEAPLVAGLADDLESAGILAFGPSRAAAQLEGSKAFMKELCTSSNIPTAAFEAFTDAAAAKLYIEKQGAPIVVKADGLAGGKGVIVAQSTAEAATAVDDLMINQALGSAGSQIVVEEFLTGTEVSFFALIDGHVCRPLGSAQDHKAVGEGNTGPNTGGMGAFSPSPIFTPELEAQVMEEVVQRTADAMVARGCPFRGVLFAGLMVSNGKAKLLEHNVRFGDPECQCLMIRLQSDLLEVLVAACSGRLADVSMQWASQVALTVIIAAKGYPGGYKSGTPINGLDKVTGAKVFHSGTKQNASGQVVSAGGRVLAVTAMADDQQEAQRLAYKAVKQIDWPDAYYRRDIGSLVT